MATNPLIFSPTPTPTTTATLTGGVTNATPLPAAETSNPFVAPSNPALAPAAAPTSSGTTYGATTSDPAQMLKNQQALVAGSNGTLKLVNGQVVSANSTLGQLSTVPNSPAGSVSGSATGSQLLAGQSAINGVTNPPPVTPKVTQGDFYNALNSYTGTTLDSGIIAQGVASGKTEEEATQEINTKVLANQAANQLSLQHQQDLAAQQASDLADTAENDAELAAAKAQVDQQMTTLGQAQTNKAADAGYGVSAVGTNQSGAAAYVAGVKSASYTQLQNLANQKQAAINSGNTKAIASINDSYNKVVADLQSKLSSDMTQQSQNAQTLAANEKSRQDTLAANTQNRATSQYNTSLSNLTSASPLSSLFDKNGLPIAGALTNPVLTNSDTYTQGIAAGLTPQGVLDSIQNAVKTSKAQTAQDKLVNETNKANLSNTILQGKVLAQQLNTAAAVGYTTNSQGSYYDSAYGAIMATGIKDTVNPATNLTTYGTIGTALSIKDMPSAKNDITSLALKAARKQDANGVNLYLGMKQVTDYMPTLQKDLAALPAKYAPGWKNGTIASITGYFGNNQGSTPAEKTAINQVRDEITHITVAYTKMINTRPTAYLTGLISGVLPNYSDINSLNVGSLDSFQGLTTSYGRSVLGGVMGANNYDEILGGGNTPALTATVPSGSTTAYSQSTGHWYAKDASGKVTQIQ